MKTSGMSSQVIPLTTGEGALHGALRGRSYATWISIQRLRYLRRPRAVVVAAGVERTGAPGC